MRVLVCGDREWDDYDFIKDTLEQLHLKSPITVVIEGEARGADYSAREAAESLDIPVLAFPANWTAYGKAAGAIRNTQMLKEGRPDLVLAFHDDLDASKGTKNMVTQARKAGIEVSCYSH